jgi:hypothetical protein
MTGRITARSMARWRGRATAARHAAGAEAAPGIRDIAPIEERHMGKRARKKKARKGSAANHGKRPNS